MTVTLPHPVLQNFIYSAKEEESLWTALEDPVLECASTRIWLGISDFQEEGIFLNVSRYSFQDVFVDSAIVGTNLKETRWGSNQPGGGVIENCVGTQR